VQIVWHFKKHVTRGIDLLFAARDLWPDCAFNNVHDCKSGMSMTGGGSPRGISEFEGRNGPIIKLYVRKIMLQNDAMGSIRAVPWTRTRSRD
jgi:hypothetical protein